MNRLLILLALTGSAYCSIVDDLKQFEGFSSVAYLDTTGNYSVGYGHRCAKSAWMSRERALAVLSDDIAIATKGARRAFATYDSQPAKIQEILVCMTFQLGQAGISKFHKFIAAINAHDYATASVEMLASRWHKQCPKRVQTLAERLTK